MNSLTKKIIAAVTAAAAGITALSGCNSAGGSPSQTGDTTAAVTEAAPAVTEQTEDNAQPGAAPLSNPVAMTADGDVDMTVALAYETDFDALIKQLDAKTVAADHPVSENTNPKTLALYQWLQSI